MTNKSYQIGVNPPSPVSRVTDVDDLIVLRSNFISIGNAFTAGYDGYGQLGNGSTNNIYWAPYNLPSTVYWTNTSMIAYSFYGIKSDGTLWGCGLNNQGQLGQGDTVNRSSPTQIGNLTNWKTLATFDMGDSNQSITIAAAIKTDGTLWTWGNNSNGGLGLGDTVNRSSPVQVGSYTNWKSVVVYSYSYNNYDSVFALKTDGTLWSWGANTYGVLGQNNTISISSPVQVGLLTNWAQISSSSAIKTDGTFWAWGQKTVFGDTTLRSSPIQVGKLSNWKQISGNCGVKTDGTLWVWGSNSYGQLGLSDTISRSSPTQVGILTNWYQASGTNSGNIATAIKIDGSLWLVGANGYSSPTQITTSLNWKSVNTGYNSFTGITYPF